MRKPMVRFTVPALLAILALVIAVLSAWAGPAPAQNVGTPTPAGPAKNTAAPVVLVAGPDDALTRIRNTGRMIVGTSADYPPFEYRAADFSIAGFDADLMREIARRLGVTLELRDFAFDGLLGAVQLDQLDAAIAALSVTDERSQQVDFSKVYYQAEDAILAPPDFTGVTVRLPENMQDATVGVQRGSVYETWAQRELVGTGLIKPANLVPYVDARQGVGDLKAKKIDYFLLDAAPAQDFVKQGDAKLVGKGLNPQRFAIVVSKSSPALTQQINVVLEQMTADGTLAALVDRGLRGIEATPTPVPGTPTPTPVPTATPVPPCVHSMAWVADLTYDDSKAPPVLAPGQRFTKTWRVRNSGTCAWQPGFALAFVTGSRMSGQPFVLSRAVPVGGTVDASLPMVAPTIPGIYYGTWQMQDDKGKSFGERIWVGIQIPGAPPPPGPTPAPPPPAVPPAVMQISNFSVSKSTINKGQCVTIDWQFSGPVVAQVLRRNGGVLTTDLYARSFRDCPSSTGTMNYQLEATNGVTPRYADRDVEVR